jgi:hypothetical protein
VGCRSDRGSNARGLGDSLMARKKKDDWSKGWDAAWEVIFGRPYSMRKTYKITDTTKFPEYLRDLGQVKSSYTKKQKAKTKRNRKAREKRRKK